MPATPPGEHVSDGEPGFDLEIGSQCSKIKTKNAPNVLTFYTGDRDLTWGNEGLYLSTSVSSRGHGHNTKRVDLRDDTNQTRAKLGSVVESIFEDGPNYTHHFPFETDSLWGNSNETIAVNRRSFLHALQVKIKVNQNSYLHWWLRLPGRLFVVWCLLQSFVVAVTLLVNAFLIGCLRIYVTEEDNDIGTAAANFHILCVTVLIGMMMYIFGQIFSDIFAFIRFAWTPVLGIERSILCVCCANNLYIDVALALRTAVFIVGTSIAMIKTSVEFSQSYSKEARMDALATGFASFAEISVWIGCLLTALAMSARAIVTWYQMFEYVYSRDVETEETTFWKRVKARCNIRRLRKILRIDDDKTADVCSQTPKCRGLGAFLMFTSPISLSIGMSLGKGSHTAVGWGLLIPVSALIVWLNRGWYARGKVGRAHVDRTQAPSRAFSQSGYPETPPRYEAPEEEADLDRRSNTYRKEQARLCLEATGRVLQPCTINCFICWFLFVPLMLFLLWIANGLTSTYLTRTPFVNVQQQPYPVCNSVGFMGRNLSLGIADVVYLANAPYEGIHENLSAHFNAMWGSEMWTIVHDSPHTDPSFFHIKESNSMHHVIAVRGTQSVADMFTDIELFTPIVALQFISTFLPVLSMWPYRFTQDFIKETSEFSEAMTSGITLNYYGIIDDYATSVASALTPEQNLYLIGHSLGGGVSSIVAGRLREKGFDNVNSLTVSPPGVFYSSKSFGIENAFETLHHTSFSIYADLDVFPQVDVHRGSTAILECSGGRSSAECHSALTTMCELLTKCGSSALSPSSNFSYALCVCNGTIATAHDPDTSANKCL